jgi:hypothetical protein
VLRKDKVYKGYGIEVKVWERILHFLFCKLSLYVVRHFYLGRKAYGIKIRLIFNA